ENKIKSYSDDGKAYVDTITLNENPIVDSNEDLDKSLNIDINNTHKGNEEETSSNIHKDELIFAYRNPSPPKLESFNPSIPCLSEALSMQYSQDKGRFIVANRDIMPGEILGVDKGYVSCISLRDPDVICNFCCLCFGRAPAPLPCPECNMVVFCSEECRMVGLEKFHWAECPSLPALANLGHTACLIKTHRIITQTSYPVVIKMLPNLKEQTQEKIRQEQGVNEN
ncbi:unnamed protein product, partial [Meganyctiphanes norvegica]